MGFRSDEKKRKNLREGLVFTSHIADEKEFVKEKNKYKYLK